MSMHWYHLPLGSSLPIIDCLNTCFCPHESVIDQSPAATAQTHFEFHPAVQESLHSVMLRCLAGRLRRKRTSHSEVLTFVAPER